MSRYFELYSIEFLPFRHFWFRLFSCFEIFECERNFLMIIIKFNKMNSIIIIMIIQSNINFWICVSFECFSSNIYRQNVLLVLGKSRYQCMKNLSNLNENRYLWYWFSHKMWLNLPDGREIAWIVDFSHNFRVLGSFFWPIFPIFRKKVLVEKVAGWHTCSHWKFLVNFVENWRSSNFF